MISVIVGHTVRNRYVRGMIYSVHMPLFFFLSGITVKVPSSIRNWSTLAKKSAHQLLIPYLFCSIVFALRDYRGQPIKSFVLDYSQTIIWGNGIDIRYHGKRIHYIGRPWFFVALFWGRIIHSAVLLLSSNPITRGMISIVLTGLGVITGGHQFGRYHLPWSYDVVFSVQCFFMIGKRFNRKIKFHWKFIIVLFVSSFAWWKSFCWILYRSHYYLDLAPRQYPLFPLCYCVTILGIISILSGSVLLQSIPALNRSIAYIGCHSLTLYIIHCFDFFASKSFTHSKSHNLNAVVRVLINLCLFIFARIVPW